VTRLDPNCLSTEVTQRLSKQLHLSRSPIPAQLHTATLEAARKAIANRDWPQALGYLHAGFEVAAELCEQLAQAVDEAASIDELHRLLGVCDQIRSADLLQVLQRIPASFFKLAPAWAPAAFADADLEDDESDEKENSDDAASSSSTRSAESKVEDGDSLSGNDALRVAIDCLHKFAALCNGLAGATALPSVLAGMLAEATAAAEGSDECADGRPAATVTVEAFAAAPEARPHCRLLDGAAALELADDCCADLAGLPANTKRVCVQRGTYPKPTLRKHLFLRPTAALGQLLCAAESLCSDTDELRPVDSWLEALVQSVKIQAMFTRKPQAALRSIARRVLTAVHDDVLVQVAAKEAENVVSLLLLMATSGVVDPARVGVLLRARVSACLDSVNPADSLAVISALNHCEQHLAEFSLPSDLSALAWAALDKSPNLEIATLALMCLRLSPKPPPMTPQIVRRLVRLRDAAVKPDFFSVIAIAQAMLLPCHDAGMCSEIVVEAERSLVKLYSLTHLPTNGKLGQRSPHAAPLPTQTFRDIAAMIRALRRGVLRLGSVFPNGGGLDSLRASCNLVMFDCCCECVRRLKDASADNVLDLCDALADVADAIEGTTRSEVKTLRASPSSIATIANLVVGLHFWICSRLPKFLAEDVGETEMQSVVAFANRLASIVLTDNDEAQSIAALLPILGRAPVRPMGRRQPGAGGEVKPRDGFRHLKTCVGTTKSRLALLTYFGCWVVCLSNERRILALPRDEMTALESHDAVYQLLDIIFALSSSQPEHGGRSGATILTDNGSHLGFDFAVLGERVAFTNQRTAAAHLASCGFAVLSLLLQRRTVRFVRSWVDGLSRAVRVNFEGFVCRHLSPALIQTALAEVLAQSPDGSVKFTPTDCPGDVVVTVLESEATVSARFTADDVSFDVKFILPKAYPLQPATLDKDAIKTRARVGVPADKWRAWMMKISITLLNGGSSVWQSIVQIASNLQQQLEGVEPCPICYSVIASTNQTLPEMGCVVCKNKFHSRCLYEWWGNSGQTSCPMCRSPWFSQK
jgi:hypothetical protein